MKGARPAGRLGGISSCLIVSVTVAAHGDGAVGEHCFKVNKKIALRGLTPAQSGLPEQGGRSVCVINQQLGNDNDGDRQASSTLVCGVVWSH